jgi:GntR family mannosyl-D-glycerate transport/metabolism transcriptional repressor
MPIKHNVYTLQRFTEEIKKLNKEPVNKILEFKMLNTDGKVKYILELQEDEKAFFVSRLRC